MLHPHLCTLHSPIPSLRRRMGPRTTHATLRPGTRCLVATEARSLIGTRLIGTTADRHSPRIAAPRAPRAPPSGTSSTHAPGSRTGPHGRVLTLLSFPSFTAVYCCQAARRASVQLALMLHSLTRPISTDPGSPAPTNASTPLCARCAPVLARPPAGSVLSARPRAPRTRPRARSHCASLPCAAADRHFATCWRYRHDALRPPAGHAAPCNRIAPASRAVPHGCESTIIRAGGRQHKAHGFSTLPPGVVFSLCAGART